jgi:hypothetical protein
LDHTIYYGHSRIYFFLLFKGFSKVLICGGYNPNINSCEFIDLESSATTCKNPPNFPTTVYQAIGGFGLKENPIICGGFQNDIKSSRCFSLVNNNWVSSAGMQSIRNVAALAQLPNGKLLVTGGSNGLGDGLGSAEMLTKDGWESNIASLPIRIVSHCMVTINSTTVMVIGGMNNGRWSRMTFYFTIGEESMIEGPELNSKRSDHSCGRIKKDKEGQELSIIVAGGWAGGSSYLSSVEILDDGSNEWQTGPELPFGIERSQMVEDQNGGVVLIGGDSSSGILDTLYHLPHGGQDAAWTKMDQKLKTVRFWHTAFLVPDKIVDCS